ncbi:hypothetical protein TNCV_1600821 [Trichonephila clavipes]|nr:hypothetical protein TNCV_1600821 [Trichonephila clavipes]
MEDRQWSWARNHDTPATSPLPSSLGYRRLLNSTEQHKKNCTPILKKHCAKNEKSPAIPLGSWVLEISFLADLLSTKDHVCQVSNVSVLYIISHDERYSHKPSISRFLLKSCSKEIFTQQTKEVCRISSP